MPSIGPLELAIVAIIALIIFGPKRLPELGGSVGKGIREFKSSISSDNETDDSRAKALERRTSDVNASAVHDADERERVPSA